MYYPWMWQEWLEYILIFSFFYTVHRWFLKDTRMPLIIYLYLYITFACIAYCAELHTITFLIPLITPTFLVILVLMHKDTLQHNLIPYKNTDLAIAPPDWISLVLRAALHNFNEDCSIAILIECSDELAPFLRAPYIFNVPIQQQLLTMLLQSKIPSSHAMLWLTKQGTIITNNAAWQKHDLYKPKNNETPFEYQKNMALLYSATMDFMFIIVHQHNRSATIIVGGKISEQPTLHRAHAAIMQHLDCKKLYQNRNENSYEKHNLFSQQNRTS